MTDTDAEACFTEEEVVEQAKANVTGSALALLRYAREHGEAPETAARWLGEMFAPGWEEMGGKGARTVARMAALNIVSSGATLLHCAGSRHTSRGAVLSGWLGPTASWNSNPQHPPSAYRSGSRRRPPFTLASIADLSTRAAPRQRTLPEWRFCIARSAGTRRCLTEGAPTSSPARAFPILSPATGVGR